MYDLIVVGSGLYGATIAYLARQRGLRCLVLERRELVGGNIRDEWQNGINVHLYGAHIFHTDDVEVWNFVNGFAHFVPYIHTVLAHNAGKLYHLPFNLNTFYDVYGVESPSEVDRILAKEHEKEYYAVPDNLEEKAVNLIGRTLYELLVKEYTEKQWGASAKELSPNLITRLPIRKTFDNRYFNDRYQGIPKEGYSHIINGMLKGTEVLVGVDFCRDKDYWLQQARRIICTGSIDELMDYRLGELEYRSLEFRTEWRNLPSYQGMAVINETGADVPYTRTIEHKHFCYAPKAACTIITREYPQTWCRGREAYYPVNNERNDGLHRQYQELAKEVYPKIIFGGRLADYQYYDMDDTIASAMSLSSKL